MGVGAIIYSFPTSILSAMVASGEAKSGLAFAFMIPVLAQLVRYHVAVAIASLCFGVVGVLARFMVFRNNPAAMVEEKKSKK